MSLKGYFCWVLLAAWNLGSWEFLISVPFDVRIGTTFVINELTKELYLVYKETRVFTYYFKCLWLSFGSSRFIFYTKVCHSSHWYDNIIYTCNNHATNSFSLIELF